MMQPSESPIPFPGVAVRPVDASDTATDARLLAELATGRSGALAELYRRRGGTMHGLLARMLGDDREAEEALQDTFVQIWRRARNYDAAKAGPFTWMVMVARGLALDRLRRRARVAAISAITDQHRSPAGVQIGPHLETAMADVSGKEEMISNFKARVAT